MSNPYQMYAKKHGEPGKGDGLFLKTEGGNTYRLIILSNAFHHITEFEDRISDRYAWAVYNTEEKKIQVLDKGISVFKQVYALAVDDDWGYPQHDYDIKLTHTGSGLDTEYSLLPGKKLNDVEATKKLLAEAEKIDFQKLFGGGNWIDEETEDRGDDSGKDEAPLDDDVIIDDVDDEPVDLSDVPF
jgi:hypothetical protein